MEKKYHIWDRVKALFKGEHRKFAWFVVVTTGIFLLLWIVGPGNTFIHWAKAGLEISRQEKVIRDYQQQNEELDRRINMIRTDRDTLEKFAREQFRFAAPGEDVYLLEE